MLIGEILTNTAEEKGEKAAAVFEERELTYSQLETKTNQLANGLLELGLEIDDMASILLPNSLEFLISYFGIMKSGATMVPLNVMYEPPAIEYVLNNSEAKVLITSQKFLPKIKNCDLEHLEEIIIVEEESVGGCQNLSEFWSQPDYPPHLEGVTESSVAACLYTSGTTGDPKGAMLTHNNLIFDTEACIERLDVDDTDRYLCVLPMFHAFAETVCMLMPVYLGAQLVIKEQFLPKSVLETMEQQEITFFAAVPTMYTAMLHVNDKEKYDLTNLDNCISGGAAMPLKTLEDFEKTFGVTILEGNGPTETSPVAYVNPPEGPIKPGSVGLPLSGVNVKIVDENDNELPRGKVGEIAVQGANVMKKYFKKPQATKQALRSGWFHTGDMGKMDEDGYVYIVDRKKNMINVGGMNVYPREIEEHLYRHSKIQEAAVVAAKDELRGEIPKAYVVTKQSQEISPQQVKVYCRNQFANYKVPKLVEIVDELPKSATGKIDKKQLK